MSKLYKIVGLNGEPLHGGSGNWSLPKRGKPGAWMPPVTGEVEACSNGYHLVPAAGIRSWLKVPALLFEAEGRGASDKEGEKTAFEQARLLRLVGEITGPVLVTWAADCAERVLPIFEKKYPKDKRPRKAIEAARSGSAAANAANAAANAANAAAANAAIAAAYAAANAANAATANAANAAYAATDAAANAAYAATANAANAAYAASYDAYAAAYDAADAAERRWQNARLIKLIGAKS